MLTAERLREVLSFDPESGVFTWRVSNGRRAVAGREAGFVHSKGYRRIRIDGALYEAHRLAFLFMTGAWPTQGIDHRDGDPSNNAWSNLREATPSQNRANSRPQCSALPKGVSWNGSGFRARISANGDRVHLGTYATPAEAALVYKAAAKDLHGEFARVA